MTIIHQASKFFLGDVGVSWDVNDHNLDQSYKTIYNDIIMQMFSWWETL